MKKKNVLNCLVVLSLSCTLGFAATKTSVDGNFIPKNMLQDSANFTTPEQIKNKFEINIDQMTVKKVLNRKDRYSSILDDLFDAEVLSKEIIKPLKTMDTIYSHPSFISLVKFPPGIKINSAKTTTKMTEFSFSENILMFSLDKQSSVGNIVITAFDREIKKNKVFNFIVKKYSNNNTKFDNEYGYYATSSGEFLSLSTFYTQMQTINPVKLLQKYVQLNGLQYFKEQFKNDGSKEILLINGVPISIVRDEKNGLIEYYDMNFQINIGG